MKLGLVWLLNDVELKMLSVSHHGKGAKNGAPNTALVAQRCY
jgi:hypothetical protein